MRSVSIRAGSIEYRYWPLSVVDADGLPIDITDKEVWLALRARDVATEPAFHQVEWDPDSSSTTIRVLVGLGDWVLTADTYSVFAKVISDPEVPIFGPDLMGELWVRAL